MKVCAGEFRKIYDPSPNEEKAWYINDHTLVRGADGWHLFGITHEEPEDPLNEKNCAHAFSGDLLGEPFCKLPFPLSAEERCGELHFWAPHIVLHERLYYMFYCAGSLESHERYRIHLAVSEDLYHWERHPENPILIDGFDARDPMVIRVGDKWVMYYACTSSPAGGNYCVACVQSDDLIHWGGKRIVFRSELLGTYGGPCESPFVERVGDMYYLFIGPYGGYSASYSDTAVYESADPFNFSADSQVGRIPAHASEVVCIGGQHYVTHCGWGEGGVYIAPLYFEQDS